MNEKQGIESFEGRKARVAAHAKAEAVRREKARAALRETNPDIGHNKPHLHKGLHQQPNPIGQGSQEQEDSEDDLRKAFEAGVREAFDADARERARRSEEMTRQQQVQVEQRRQDEEDNEDDLREAFEREVRRVFDADARERARKNEQMIGQARAAPGPWRRS